MAARRAVGFSGPGMLRSRSQSEGKSACGGDDMSVHLLFQEALF